MTAITAHARPPAGGSRAIALVCAAHFFSHFYMLILPALLPVLTAVYDVGFTELGFAITAYSLATGALQAPVGFLVDRFGARRLLIAAVFVKAIAFACIGLSDSYAVLVALMLAAGAANSVFHPADYAILNASVPDHRMGRAFSLHGFSAQIGNAAGPLTVLALLTVMSFQSALLICGLGGLLVGVALTAGTHVLREQPTPAAASGDDGARRGLALLLSLPILLGFAFYACSAMYHRGMTGFGVAATHLLHDFPLTEAGVGLAGYLVASPCGVLCGGWIADRTHRHTLVAVLAFLVIGLAAAALAMADAELPVVVAGFAAIGFTAGVMAPSRDMLIRSVPPSGETGKVFGFVSAGLNLGGVVTPPVFGYLLDTGDPAWVFWGIGLIASAGVAIALASGAVTDRAVR